MREAIKKSEQLLSTNLETMNSSNEQNLDKMVMEFVAVFSVVCVLGLVCGAGLVCCYLRSSKQRQAKRLAMAQTNPAFRFAETTDPSASTGGIPAMNPIAHEDIANQDRDIVETDTDNVMTDRGLTFTPKKFN